MTATSYVFLAAVAAVLLVRAISFRQRMESASMLAQDLKDFMEESERLLAEIRKERVQLPAGNRLELLRKADQILYEMRERIGLSGRHRSVVLFRIMVFVDMLLDLFSVLVFLALAAVLLGAFDLDWDIIRIGIGMQIVGSMIFPFIIKQVQRRCATFVAAQELRLSAAMSIKRGDVPEDVVKVLLGSPD